MRKLLNRKIIEQDRKCSICPQEFTDYNDIVPNHRDRKEWEERGGTTIQTTSKPFIGGQFGKRLNQS